MKKGVHWTPFLYAVFQLFAVLSRAAAKGLLEAGGEMGVAGKAAVFCDFLQSIIGAEDLGGSMT